MEDDKLEKEAAKLKGLSHYSFGRAQSNNLKEKKDRQKKEQKTDNKKSKKNNIKKIIGKDDGFVLPPTLKAFIDRLDTSNVIPCVSPRLDFEECDGSEDEYANKIEGYVEIISKEIHDKVDSRILSAATPD